MMHYRCKCGATTSFGSMGPAPCFTCDKCGSDLASSPGAHRDPPLDHEWVTRYDEITGEPYEICQRCFEKKDQQ